MSQPVDAPGPERLSENDVQAIDHLRDAYARLRKELGRVIVGQQDVIERLAICLFARGHALLMGVPGLAKTLMVNKLAETMSLKFSRIQFTPDLMPMDITGTDILQDSAGRPAGVPVRPWAGLRQHRARRRDQPRPAEDPGGAARGDAGAQRHGAWGRSSTWMPRSWCWPPRTRSSRRGPIRCPRRSSIGSCS